MYRIAIILSLVTASFGAPNAIAKSCHDEIAPIVAEISKRSKELLKSVPKNESGRQVNVGSCASRLKKLDGNFLCCKTLPQTAKIWEEISCLELKKYYLRKTCECAGVAGGFTTDEVIQDEVFERLAAIKLIRKSILAKGIPNKAIKEYVAKMSAAVDCMNANSLLILADVERGLTNVLAKVD